MPATKTPSMKMEYDYLNGGNTQKSDINGKPQRSTWGMQKEKKKKNYTNDFGTLVQLPCPGTWHERVSVMTGWLAVTG